MSEDRKKPGVVFWAAVVVCLPLLYVLSIGPVCRMVAHPRQERVDAPAVYMPIGLIVVRSAPYTFEPLRSYLHLWLPSSVRTVAVPFWQHVSVAIQINR
jgi:hypothetical protein